MFFFLSKVLLGITYPLTWILILLIGAFFTRGKALSRKLVVSAIVVFLLFSNAVIFSEVMRAWEGKSPRLTRETYNAAIVLGGYSSWNDREGTVNFHESADRFIKACELYHQGVVEKIILSGGSGLLSKPEERESAWARDTLIRLGIPEADIMVENHSRNTYENARYTARMLEEQDGKAGHYLLITSAFHMKRAGRCFRSQGLTVDEMPVDFQIGDRDYVLSTYLLPSAVILDRWSMLIKEWLGFVVYAMRGYF